MSERDPIRVFVTHAWEASDDYLRVFEYLECARNFYYRNTSTPEQAPSGDGEALRQNLRAQIEGAEAVVALASLFLTNKDLLIFQMNCAKGLHKPVVLMPGFGRSVILPKDVAQLADEQAAWDERALVDAVRQLARHENTARWDVIEFKLD